MSLELALTTLAEAMNAHTAALDRNTAAGLKVHGERAAQLTGEALAPKTEPVEQATPETVEDKPKKKTTKKKAKAEPETEPMPAPETEDDDLDDDLSEDDAPVATMVEVRAVAMKVRDTLGKDALKPMYKSFKVSKIAELTEENFGAFVRHCENVLKTNEV